MSGLMDHWPRLRPLRTEAALRALTEAAAADEHRVIGATHLITRERPGRGIEIVGYAGIGGAVLVTAWVDSRKVRARESLGLLSVVESLAGNVVVDVPGQGRQPARMMVQPCAQGSPFRPLMGELGYELLGNAEWCLKVL